MPADKEFAKKIGKHIEILRTGLALSQTELANRLSVAQSQISSWEHGVHAPNPGYLIGLAKAFGISVEKLTGLDKLMHEPWNLDVGKNPKPVQVGPTTLKSVYRMEADYTDGLEVSFRYKHDLRERPPALDGIWEKLAHKAEQLAREGGYPYFNGPNTRLIRCTQENTRQLPDGREQKGLVLELGPVSWEEFTVLNSFIDEEVFLEGDTKSIRERFADNNKLYSEGADLRWCKLSNLLTVHIIPITRDGFGLVQRRNKRGTAVGARKLTSGVCENIHRFKDDASLTNLMMRLNPIEESSKSREEASGRRVDHAYGPAGVPSPLLTAERGVREEVSTELYRRIKGVSTSIKFLSVIFDLDLFNPHLTGVLDLDFTRDEVMDFIMKSPGTDETEAEAFHMLSLDLSDGLTHERISDRDDWQPAGLAAFGFAARYWEERRHKS